jgi:hypothetical protein
MMSPDDVESDPLARAIGEFRKDLLLWIDKELVWLREQAPEDSVRNDELTAVVGSQFSAASGSLNAGRGSLHYPASMPRQAPPSGEQRNDVDLCRDAARPPAGGSMIRKDPQPPPPPANPRQRLDALARLLDERLKHAQGAAESTNSAGNERTKGIESGTSESSTSEVR